MTSKAWKMQEKGVRPLVGVVQGYMESVPFLLYHHDNFMCKQLWPSG